MMVDQTQLDRFRHYKKIKIIKISSAYTGRVTLAKLLQRHCLGQLNST